MANILPDMAAIVRARGLRPLNAHGTRFEDGVRVPPGTMDAILLVENDVIVHLPTTLQARQFLGWAEPAVRIIFRVNGVNRARCLVGVPTGVFGPDTILVRTLDEFRAVLN
ncbi:hypothetical protein C8F04DRAFT_1255002 [Mycena alexandri]|uniref:Uncharacterized protein n=1 Tax=Mycena alexandri TaxID=1745969 RepID=A0AAD6T8K8_9AGAR|nr:hypothetical protein C8F04DRAFT_1255002 [Mycena alexandri]